MQEQILGVLNSLRAYTLDNSGGFTNGQGVETAYLNLVE